MAGYTNNNQMESFNGNTVVAAIAIRSLFAKITQCGVLCHAKAP